MPFVGWQIRHRDPRLLILVGIVILEIGLSGLTRLTAQAGEWDLFWPLMGRGLAMAFLFVPINTVVLGQFRGPQLGQVAGLLNLFRQIGGSIGIATLSTLLQRATATNYLYVVSHVSMLNTVTANAVSQAQGLMGTRLGEDVGLASHARGAFEALTGRINAQVFVLSFNQILTVLLIAFAFALVPLALMKRPAAPAGPVSAH
jgi:DHA2 family multidrug resistance protein